ncbi:hypothetical protein GCM10010912_58010 [Paenibacillus albidus]|uniref:Type II secretion system protein GspF domain-containing protein n=1 Tax=Paenibacillus albidus TaxID=2041023 RepID=A0A917D0B4_9BACL|nr:hypothetical protein [Paenibacillus albidus]GGG05761.1 hypothetical protein GCM10010912_58010 [Paenibacillus albidus]
MILIAKLCALSSILYLIKLFLFPLLKPVSGRKKKRARRFMNERKNAELRQKLLVYKRNIAQNYIRGLLGTAERLRFRKIIDRLELGVLPEEIRLNQLLYSSGGAALTLVLGSANRLLGCVTALFILLGWIYPVKSLEERIEKKNRNIALDFPAFYSMVYYQYSKSINIYLADVVRDYLPHAGGDMAEELGVMLDNIEYGEEFALKQFKKRVPLRYIIKFCDIMETRLRGYDNVSQMVYLKNEVDHFRVEALEKELIRRERSNSRIQWVLIIVLFVYIVIYYLFLVMDSLEMFQ